MSSFRIFAACLILGVAAIAGVGSLTTSIVEGLRQEGRSLLGGDVELRLTHGPIPSDALAYLEQDATVSAVRSIRGMVYNPQSGVRTLTEVKAVDDHYPLYGEATLSDAADLQTSIAVHTTQHGEQWGAVIAPELADRLGAKVGDTVVLGDITLVIRAIMQREPDRANDGFELAPRLMVAPAVLDNSGLLQEGSLVRYAYRLKFPSAVDIPGGDIKAWETQLQARFPDADWQVRDHERSAPRLREFMERLGQFLTLVGLTTLVVGGVGVAGGVRSYLDRKTNTIATLKSLGAESSFIARLYIGQILLIAVFCIAVGLAIGAVLPSLATAVLADRLPVPPQSGIFLMPLLKAAVYGLLVVLAFALGPVTRARYTPAAALFRTAISKPNTRQTMTMRVTILVLIAAIIALPLVDTENRFLIFAFEIGAFGALCLLLATGLAIKWVVARLPRARHVITRLAIGNLHRPGAPTVGVVLALGLGLTLFATLALVEGNLGRQIRDNLPDEAPAFFFVDVQRDQIDEFIATAEAIPNIGAVKTTPYLRGQVVAINGVPADQVKVAPDARWVLRGDRGLTFSDSLPADNELTAGQWWPAGYDGPPQISFDSELAVGLGVGLGDRLTVSVLGRMIEGEIVSLRQINWGTMGINFAIMFDPHNLKPAPYSYLATINAGGETESIAYKTLTDRFPNVSAIRMKEVLGEVNALISDMANAVRVAAVITILAGILVLAGATAAGARERIYDAVILKVLGGTRRTVMAVLALEYIILGLITGVIAAMLGTVASWLIIVHIMEFKWAFLPGAVALTLVASISLTLVFGLFGAWAALGAKPAAALRGVNT